MRMDELKRGIWGYKKDSVYQYIVSLEEKASERMAEKEAKLVNLEEEMNRKLAEQERASKERIAELERTSKERMAELEAKVSVLQEENAALRGDQTAVFSTMLEAQKYADQLKADLARQNQQAQEKLYAAVRQKTRQLNDYQGQIERLRAVIGELLEDFNGKIEEVEKTLTVLTAQAPSVILDGESLDDLIFGDAMPEISGMSSAARDSDTDGISGVREIPDMSKLPAASGQDTFQAKPDKGTGKEWKRISFT